MILRGGGEGADKENKSPHSQPGAALQLILEGFRIDDGRTLGR